jgi:hypothetical protein
MGALNVYLKKNGQYGSTEWSRSRNQGNRWIRGELRIKNMKEAYQIVFEGVFMGSYSVRIVTFNVENIQFLQRAFTNYTNLDHWIR